MFLIVSMHIQWQRKWHEPPHTVNGSVCVCVRVCVCVCLCVWGGGLHHELYHKVQQRLSTCTKVLVFKGMHIKYDICTTAVQTLVNTSRRNGFWIPSGTGVIIWSNPKVSYMFWSNPKGIFHPKIAENIFTLKM